MRFIIQSNVVTFCPTESIDLANYEGNPSDPSYTLVWHTDNTTNAATLITNKVVSEGGTYQRVHNKEWNNSNCIK